MKEKYDIADKIAEDKIVEAMVPGKKKKEAPKQAQNPFEMLMNSAYGQKKEEEPEQEATTDVAMAREQVRQQLRQGLLEDQYVDIEVIDTPKGNQLDMSNEGMSIAIGNIFGDMMPNKTRTKHVRISEARKILREQEAQNLLDMEQVMLSKMLNRMGLSLSMKSIRLRPELNLQAERLFQGKAFRGIYFQS